MKKTIFLFIIIILTYVLIGEVFAKKSIIPDDAIRIRVIANSNSEYDQNIKYKVKDSLEKEMYKLLINASNVDEARQIINDNLEDIKNNVDKTLQNEEYILPFSMNFGLNYFPSKQYKGIKYNEGYYESLVVTLGEGLGDNWWCVLFPPLCMIEAESASDVEYTTFAQTLIDKYF